MYFICIVHLSIGIGIDIGIVHMGIGIGIVSLGIGIGIVSVSHALALAILSFWSGWREAKPLCIISLENQTTSQQ